MAKGFKVADAYIEVHLDDDTAKRDVASLPQRIGTDTDRAGTAVGRRMGQSIDRGLSPEVDKAGKKNGDKLSQGMQLAIVRNSPLIAAGVGAALAAGAPAAIAGAGLLFGGIGIVAAAMNDEVQQRWGKTWQTIVTETKSDASVLVGTLDKMSDQVAAGFERLRPALRLMFADMAPILQDFTGSLMNAAQNAMPGLLHAVQAAQPVFAGLGSLVENIGTGLSRFFDAIAQHSDAAGTAFAAIGQIVATLLPILGDLLGQGAELAADVLPPLASILGVVGDALHAIAPILPAVAIGFGAFKIVSSLNGPLGSFANSLSNLASKNIPGFSTAAGAASSAVGKLSSALPVLGVAIGAATIMWERDTDQAKQWAQAILDGGQAAATAQAQMSDFGSAMEATNSGFSGFISNMLGLGTPAANTAIALGQVDDQQKALLASMTPLQRAQQDVTKAQNDLNKAVYDHGPASAQAASAAADLAAAQAEVQRQEAATQFAIEGVTEAMINQANQALANASSSFAYDQATQQVADAQAHLAEVQKDSKSTSSDLNNATNSLNQALLAQVQAAGRLASDALPSAASETQKATAANSAMLQQLYQLKDTMGSQFPAALQNAINGLVASGATAGNYSAAAYNAMGATQSFIGSLFNLGQQHPVPTVSLNDQASGPASSIRNLIASIQSKTVTVTVRQSVIGALTGIASAARGAEGGEVGSLKMTKKRRMSLGGPVIGPGTATSDDVPFWSSKGLTWLGNTEYVITGAARRALEAQYGRSVMPTINSGRLPVATDTGSSGSMAKVQGGGINIASLTVQISGTYDLASSSDLRKAAGVLRQEFIKLDRETR